MKFKVKPTNRVVNFKCELDCGGQCCTGATMALPAEVKNVYDKVPDPEGFDKSFVKLQYEILLNAKEVEKELDKIIALKESDPEAFEKSVLAQKYKIFKANKIFENFGYKA